MKKETEDPGEPISITDDDMRIIVAMAKAIKAYSKNRTVSSLMKELQLEEICRKDDQDKNQIIWEKPMIDLVKKVEKKFSTRLKQLKKAGLI
jgi:hypothetical protein